MSLNINISTGQAVARLSGGFEDWASDKVLRKIWVMIEGAAGVGTSATVSAKTASILLQVGQTVTLHRAILAATVSVMTDLVATEARVAVDAVLAAAAGVARLAAGTACRLKSLALAKAS